MCVCARLVSFTIREKVETELGRMVAISIIKPVYFSERASPIVLVLKRNGQVRICGDLKQTVCPILQIDKYPIPNIEDLYSKVSGGGIILRDKIRVVFIYRFLWTKSYRE